MKMAGLLKFLSVFLLAVAFCSAEDEKDVDGDGRYTGGYDSDCSESSYINPDGARKNYKIELENEVLNEKANKSPIKCHWNVFGTDFCRPMITCGKFSIKKDTGGDAANPCPDEYFEITDGLGGLERFCGDTAIDSITTSKPTGEQLPPRDLYITFKSSGKKGDKRKIECTVTCVDYKGDAGELKKAEGKMKPLKANFEPQEINKDCDCGRKPNKNRIVGGEDAFKGEFPWIVALVTAKTRKPYCGGTIINDRFVITAAHCFKGDYLKASGFQMMANARNLDFTSTGSEKSKGLTDEELLAIDTADNAVRLSVEKFYIHPLYVRQTNDYDVALIKFTEKLDFAKYPQIRPACFPLIGTYHDGNEGIKATVSGWGLNSSDATITMAVLQKLEIEIFKASECKTFFDERVNRRMMCAGYREGGKDSCKGDSGGPLISERKPQQWDLVGTVSWGEGCAAKNSPGVYIRTNEIEEWVRYIVNLESGVWCKLP